MIKNKLKPYIKIMNNTYPDYKKKFNACFSSGRYPTIWADGYNNNLQS